MFYPNVEEISMLVFNGHGVKWFSHRMAPNKTRLTYIGLNEKPTPVVIKSMCITGGRGAMRQMLIAGGWDKEELIATPVSRLDRNSVITGTYWLLQGESKLLCITA